jgi:hypothetical protein
LKARHKAQRERKARRKAGVASAQDLLDEVAERKLRRAEKEKKREKEQEEKEKAEMKMPNPRAPIDIPTFGPYGEKVVISFQPPMGRNPGALHGAKVRHRL